MADEKRWRSAAVGFRRAAPAPLRHLRCSHEERGDHSAISLSAKAASMVFPAVRHLMAVTSPASASVHTPMLEVTVLAGHLQVEE
jgi:hypothetical protein